MLSYLEFIVEYENAMQKVHHKATVGTLKALAINNPGKPFRYVVDHEGSLHFANAMGHTHEQIHTSSEGTSLNGYAVADHEGKLHHRIRYYHNQKILDDHGVKNRVGFPAEEQHYQHPTIKKMEERGFNRREKPFHFER